MLQCAKVSLRKILCRILLRLISSCFTCRWCFYLHDFGRCRYYAEEFCYFVKEKTMSTRSWSYGHKLVKQQRAFYSNFAHKIWIKSEGKKYQGLYSVIWNYGICILRKKTMMLLICHILFLFVSTAIWTYQLSIDI